MDDFARMDNEAGVDVLEPVGLPTLSTDSSLSSKANNVIDLRNSLVKEYHNGASSLIERMGDSFDSDDLLKALIVEVIKETDHLLGNELVATNNGDLRDSSVISFKRAEAIEKAIKALNAKRALEKESGIDVDSPSMVVIFKFFMEKVDETFDKMKMESEMKDIFYKLIGDATKNWKIELKRKFKQLKSEASGI